jgi:hypothetical protein
LLIHKKLRKINDKMIEMRGKKKKKAHPKGEKKGRKDKMINQ